MAENSASEAESADKTEAAKNDSVDNKETATKPLQMSFADWKKTKEATRNVRKPFKNENNNKQQPGFNRNHNNINNNSYNNNNNNNNNSYPPLSRPPPLPFPLMSMSFNNFGPGPGPCGPSTMTPPGNMSNMGNMGPGPSGRKHRPLQPPPFWEDMMSPQLRPPPIQPPMPKCPSLWNLVPKEKQKIHSSKQNHQPNKKYKSSNNNNSNSDNALLDAALMPPPPPPGESGANSTSNLSSSKSSENRVVKKKKNGGTFIQIDGKWIQRPEAPLPLEEAPPGTKEDRQRQWREYRQAMKPFKNREFHNYKRTVQRLSKIPREDLDEKQLERLQKAEEYIGAHKAMLTIKHAEQWVQQSSQKSDGLGNSAGSGQASGQIPVTGQVYVRKPANAAWHKNSDPNTFQRAPIRKQVFGTGRAIKGGVGGELGVMPPLPAGSVAGISQYANYFDPTQQGVNSGLYGQDMASSSNNISINNSSSFYSSYNSSFVKGGTLLPP